MDNQEVITDQNTIGQSTVTVESDNIENPQDIPQESQATEVPVLSNKVEKQTQAVQGEIVEKHAGGRPSKYNDEILTKTKLYFEHCFKGQKTNEGQWIAKPRTPFIEELQLELDVDDDTIVEWAKKFPEFSATYNKLKLLYKLRLKQILTKGKSNPLGPKFLLETEFNMIVSEKRILAGERNSDPLQVAIKEYTPASEVAKHLADNATS